MDITTRLNMYMHAFFVFKNSKKSQEMTWLIYMSTIYMPPTDCRVVAVRKRFVRTLAHKHPLVVLELALDDFAVQFAQHFGALHLRERLVVLANVQAGDFTANDTAQQSQTKKMQYRHLRCYGHFQRWTHPRPLSSTIFTLKSTEFSSAGFHFSTSLHGPQVYGYREQMTIPIYHPERATNRNTCIVNRNSMHYI